MIEKEYDAINRKISKEGASPELLEIKKCYDHRIHQLSIRKRKSALRYSKCTLPLTPSVVDIANGSGDPRRPNDYSLTNVRKTFRIILNIIGALDYAFKTT